MKRKILSVLGVLMAVLIFCGCSNLSTASGNLSTDGAQSSGGSGESVSTGQGGEPSVSESAAESSGESGAQSENAVQPESTFLAEWCGFSVYLPEESILAEYGEKSQ